MDHDQILLLDRASWARKAVEDPTAMKETGLYKATASEIRAVDTETRTIDTVVSSEARDRDRDMVRVGGWNLSNFRKNPVVLWGHDHRTPAIARGPVKRDGPHLVSTDTFPEAGTHPLADMVFELARQRILNAKSVGFLPEEWTFDEDERGFNFLKQELLEHSWVNVPSNPEALRRAREAGIDLAPMVKWAEQALDEYYGPVVIIPRDHLAQALKIADNDRFLIATRGAAQLVPRTKGATGGNLIAEAIAARAENTGATLEDVREEAGRAAGISASTVAEIEAGEIDCPPRERLEGFASLSWMPSQSQIISAFQSDGEYASDRSARSCRCQGPPRAEHQYSYRTFTEAAAAMDAILRQGGPRAEYDAIAAVYAAHEHEPPDFKLVEARVLDTLPDLYTFSLETGALERIAPPAEPEPATASDLLGTFLTERATAPAAAPVLSKDFAATVKEGLTVATRDAVRSAIAGARGRLD